ncbi:MAG: DUF5337 domain-containing protein [Halocynthiibacter sp.]
MAPGSEKDKAVARQARSLSIVIAATTILWLGGQWLGAKIGIEGRYAFLLDLAAIAAFVWVLIVLAQIWRSRRDS